MNRSAMQEEAVRHFEELFQGVSAIALTLTFTPLRKGLKPGIAAETVRQFGRRINRLSRGRKSREKPLLRMLAVQEQTIGNRIHYHLMVEVPATASPQEFADFCVDQWQKLRWGRDTQVHVTLDADEGWIRYCLKTATKPAYGDAIDWISCSNGKSDGSPKIPLLKGDGLPRAPLLIQNKAGSPLP